MGKQPVPFLQSAVIHITIEFMNPKCNFPVVLRLLAPSATWTITLGGKNMHESVYVREREEYCTQGYHYTKLLSAATVTHTHTQACTRAAVFTIK